MDWKTEMLPVTNRQPLEVVADWYLKMWVWRTQELEAGRGTGYDLDPESRINRSVVRLKFPWLSLQDEIDLVRVIRRRRRKLA